MKLRPVLEAFARSPATVELAERLPARGEALRLSGLHGSSGAVLAAWLASTFSQRLLTIVAPTPGDAERWLTDLAHLTDRASPSTRSARPWARTSRTTRSPASAPRRSRRCSRDGSACW